MKNESKEFFQFLRNQNITVVEKEIKKGYNSFTIVIDGVTLGLRIVLEGDVYSGGEVFLAEEDDFTEERKYTNKKEFYELLMLKINRVRLKNCFFKKKEMIYTLIMLSEIKNTVKYINRNFELDFEKTKQLLLEKTGLRKMEELELQLEDYSLVRNNVSKQEKLKFTHLMGEYPDFEISWSEIGLTN